MNLPRTHPVRSSGPTGQAQKDTDTALMVHFVNKNYKFGTRIDADLHG